MPQRILITPRSLTRDGHPALSRFSDAGYELITAAPGRQPSEDELIELLPGFAGMLAGVEPISAKALAAADSLRVIGRNGVGIDNIDLDAAGERGIEICRTIGANARGVAELTITLLMSLARSVPFGDAGIKAGQWRRRKGIELEDRTLGLIGCGQIGRRVATMVMGLDMRVLAFDPAADESFRPGEAFRYANDMETVLTSSDVISLHCPARPGGAPLLDAAAIERMKDGACVINTARASLLDAPAVIAALDAGKLAGVAVDVFDIEPPVDDPLAGHDRVIATPHVGGYTSESVDRAVTMAVEMMLEVLNREDA